MMDEVEKTVSSTRTEEEEIELQKDEEEAEEVEREAADASTEEEEEEDGDDEEQDVRDNAEKEDETMPQATEKNEKTVDLPAKPNERKKDEGLNLNNEVVRMRKEVKRVRALIIRKLTRQTAALKRKKGKEADIERNQRRAARLLEEIHAMKVLAPDLVTKTALQKNLNFEQTCKNPKSTITDRAIARIATHPQFNKKIENIKAAVKAFKEERMKAGKQKGKEKVQNKAGKVTPLSPEKQREAKGQKEEDDNTVKKMIIKDNEEGDNLLKDTEEVAVADYIEDTEEAAHAADTAACQMKELLESENVRPVSKGSDLTDILKNKPPIKVAEKKPELKSAPSVLPQKKDKEDSDIDSSDDEEKEYFDDSTEERFRKQSSQSEESDDDDFFVGKVSKFKKKKKQKSVGEDNEREMKPHPTDQVQKELDELESRLKSKGTSLQSVFCSSLAASKPGGGRGAGRGRGGDKFRGRGKSSGDRDFSQQSKFQKQEKGSQEKPGSKYSKPESSEHIPFGRGRGRGRGDVTRQKDHRGQGLISHQAPQQALHPSWEASKKRKEQQGQILAFQGKKIKFDDDD